MSRITLILVVIACCCAPSIASWALVPLDELVQDCDIIVVGTLTDVTEHSLNGTDFGQGTILIDEVVWGAASAGESLVLKWQNASELICPRVEHRQNQGKKALWLLMLEDDGVVRANYPGRFVDLSKRSEVEQILREKPVCLRAAKYVFGANEPVSVSLVFRNPTQSSIAFPGVESSGGQLLISPGVELTLWRGYGEERKITRPLRNRLISSNNVAPILVGPQQEIRIAVDLRNLFTISDEEGNSLQIRVKGFGRTNAIDVYLDHPTSPTTSGAITQQIVLPREKTSTLMLLIPSIVAIVVSSIFVYLHSKEIVDAVLQRRTSAT